MTELSKQDLREAIKEAERAQNFSDHQPEVLPPSRYALLTDDEKASGRFHESKPIPITRSVSIFKEITMEEPYDSAPDTRAHIARVADMLSLFAEELNRRGIAHDASKLGPEEKPQFDRETPLLKTLVFGSDEYKASLARLGTALTHHYAKNSHHAEFYQDGVAGMDLFDLVEMVIDWKAASERGKTGEMSLDYAFDRFKVEPQLQSIIRNTALRLGWVKAPSAPTGWYIRHADDRVSGPYDTEAEAQSLVHAIGSGKVEPGQ